MGITGALKFAWILALVPIDVAGHAAEPLRGVLWCRQISQIPSRDLLLAGFLGSAELLIEGDSVCTTDGGPIPGEPERLRCDWKHTIEELGSVRPDSGTELRVVRIRKNHETGSGAWDRIALLECRDQQIAPVFSREYLYGASFRSTSTTTFDVTEGYWLAKDGLCCPSHLRRTTYEWDARSRRYGPKRETFLRRDEGVGQVEVEKPSGESRSRP